MRKLLALAFTALLTMFLFPGTPVSAHHSPDHEVLVIGETSLPLNFEGCLAWMAVHEIRSMLTMGLKVSGQTWNAYLSIRACRKFSHTTVTPREVIFDADTSGKNPHSLKFVRVKNEDDGRECYMLTNWPVERPQAAETLAPAH